MPPETSDIPQLFRVRAATDENRLTLDLISDVLPFSRLWYDTPDHAIGYAMHRSRSYGAVTAIIPSESEELVDIPDTLPERQEFFIEQTIV